ncbi:MAG TPA: prolyl oligopeptidase family serine peptidase [Usitatibacter sp.]|nr:prolyl oligopeptidase family serine peptidase [Usitatibacter sp.]
MRGLAAVLVSLLPLASMAQEDPYLWLEDVTGDKAVAWVKEQNKTSQGELEARPEFKALHERLLAIYNSKERIPFAAKRGPWLYNFWQDADNPRGIWRRTTMEEYRKADPKWETVIDIGKLSADENEKWVFKGASCLYPDYERCLVSLSRAGADAVEVREFDARAKQWVKDGFRAPESKGELVWRDRDTVYAARDFGAGSLTTSGYPRTVREWKRGTPLADAKTIFEGRETDVSAGAAVVNEPGRRYELLTRAIDFWNSEHSILRDGKWVRLETPLDSQVDVFNGMLVVKLRTDWKPAARNFRAGSLIATSLDAFLSGKRDFEPIFEPKERVSLQALALTKNFILLDVLDNVKGRVVEARLAGDAWKLRDVAVPPAASIGVSAVDRDENDDYWMTVTSFTEPTTLYLAHAGGDGRDKLKQLPAFFDAKGVTVTQYEATSRDGTKIPYFVVMREGTKLDGTNPTILYGYGGFEVSMTPSYNATMGASWLERGGVYALANLRGGGEFGPEWHTTALREGRQKTHDDFAAVAEDLVKRKVSSPRHLGIMGGSQGGLLVGTTFTQHPELFRAVVCQVPLLDMKRYSKLLAGASWMGEYGDPDKPGDWAFISKYSPYQNVAKDKKYPRVFFWTSTRDDRVHPGHARKMFARMKEQGHDVLYFEYLEGGHGAGSLPAQQAYTWALTYAFFLEELR